jgi:hypothetical protein
MVDGMSDTPDAPDSDFPVDDASEQADTAAALDAPEVHGVVDEQQQS